MRRLLVPLKIEGSTLREQGNPFRMSASLSTAAKYQRPAAHTGLTSISSPFNGGEASGRSGRKHKLFDSGLECMQSTIDVQHHDGKHGM